MSESTIDNRPHDGSFRDLLRYYGRKLKRRPMYRAWHESSRNVKRFVPLMWRLATHEFRELPAAIIVGAMKGGTTQLFAYLIRHPRLFPPCNKELDYFSRHSDKTLQWYRSRFPLRRRLRATRGLCLEASPSYLSTPSAWPKMHAVLPEVRLVAVLRDPVSRAFSHYQHLKTRHKEQRSFAQAIEEQLMQDRVRAQWGAAPGAGGPDFSGYVARGYYALQLEPLLRLYPREQVLILDSADLFADTNDACQRVFDFLGVEPYDVQPGKVYNRGYYKETIDPAVAARLRNHFRPHDELLAELLGRSFSWMPHRLAKAA
jgi:hypothetical protein